MHSLKSNLSRSKWYWFLRELNRAVRSTLKDWDKTYNQYRCVTITPKNSSRGNVLVSYFNTLGHNRGIGADRHPIERFFGPMALPPPVFHNEWECRQMVQTFLDMGYTVDVISWKNTQFIPQKEYSVFVDVRHNMERLSPLLDKACVKIQHIDTAHMLFHQAGEASALLALQQRRGMTLRGGRTEMPNLGIEHAHAATILGNRFTIETFRYANKPLYPLPVTPAFLYPSPGEKDFARCAKRFLWLGTAGLVFKGLDVVLEAFAHMPDYHLTICGPIRHEPHFEKAYYKELYQTPNIHTVGWVNVGSPEFAALASECCGVVSASCSEGQSGSVVTGLHLGLIPIISYECGVDVDGFGLILRERSIRAVQEAVWSVSQLSASQLQLWALRAWRQAQTYYTRQLFALKYRKSVETILASQPPVKVRVRPEAVPETTHAA